MNELILDGKKYELSPELVEKIKAEVAAQEKEENPFERKTTERYYYADAAGTVYSFVDDKGRTANALYSVGNYCRDKAIIEQRALHETLNRLLWRYSEEHGGDAEWNSNNKHYYIYKFSDASGGFHVHCNDTDHAEGVVYFADEVSAHAAIQEVIKPFMAEHPEFVW